MALSERADASSPLQSYLGLPPVQADHSLVVMAETLPIVSFLGFMDGAATIGGGGTIVKGGGVVPIDGDVAHSWFCWF